MGTERTEESRQENREKREVKAEVAKAKQRAYNDLYARLDSREGEHDRFSIPSTQSLDLCTSKYILPSRTCQV